MAKQLRKAPVSLVMPIHLPFHPSVLMKQCDSQRTDLSDISYLCVCFFFFTKTCRYPPILVNLLAPELFFFILAHTVYKM